MTKNNPSVKTEVLDSNVDSTLATRTNTLRKAKGIFSYEFSFMFNGEMSFGSSIYKSLLKAFSKVFEWEGLPEGIRAEEMEMFLVQSGRLKGIKILNEYYVVHAVPKKFNQYGDWIESSIIEPYLPHLTGKSVEKFRNVELKNDVLGQSLIRLVYPFIKAIDDALFNLENNQAILSGKFVHLDPNSSGKDDNTEQEIALSNWLINGKPVKVFGTAGDILNDGELPLKKIEVDDSTQSFIETIQFNYSQMLNVLGIPNNNVEGKKERLITSEINIQNVLQSAIIDDMLSMRERWAEGMNKEFPELNISVKVRQDSLSGELLEEGQEEPQEGEQDEH